MNLQSRHKNSSLFVDWKREKMLQHVFLYQGIIQLGVWESIQMQTLIDWAFCFYMYHERMNLFVFMKKGYRFCISIKQLIAMKTICRLPKCLIMFFNAEWNLLVINWYYSDENGYKKHSKEPFVWSSTKVYRNVFLLIIIKWHLKTLFNRKPQIFPHQHLEDSIKKIQN